MYRKYHGFLHVFTSSFQSKPTKNNGIYSVFLTRQHAKKRCFETIFHIFSARARQLKHQSLFAAILPPFIRTQEGIRSPKKTKLRLNLAFCLSQSLLQSSSPWARKCCKLRCFMNVPCILLAKPPPPQLKLTVLAPAERHALLHLRCGQILSILSRSNLCFFVYFFYFVNFFVFNFVLSYLSHGSWFSEL